MAACSQLPSQGPSASAVVSESANPASLNYVSCGGTTRARCPHDARSRDSLAGSFGGASGGTSENIGVGDIVSVTIWEAANGGLFSKPPPDRSAAGPSPSDPDQPVSSDGTIWCPMPAAVPASGRTPADVKASIEAALAGKAIEPQVLVSVTQSVTNTVTVTGDVTGGAIVPLSARGSRILDAIAASGSLKAPSDRVMVE